MPRVIKHQEASVSVARMRGGNALFALYLTRDDFRSGLRGFGVRSLEPGVELESTSIGDVDEVCFIVSGIGLLVTAEGESPVQPGDVVLTNAGESRGLRNSGAEPFVFAVFAADVKP